MLVVKSPLLIAKQWDTVSPVEIYRKTLKKTPVRSDVGFSYHVKLFLTLSFCYLLCLHVNQLIITKYTLAYSPTVPKMLSFSI